MTPSNQDIPKKIQELQSAQSQIRFWRTLSIVAVILIVVTCVGLLSTAVGQLTTAGPRQDAFLKDLTEGIDQDVIPQLQLIGTEAAADVAPLVQAELKKLNGMAPDFATSLQRELYNLSVNVSGESQKILDDGFGNMIEGRRHWLESNFSDVSHEKVETMLENLTTIAHERIEKFTDEAFAKQVISLNRITDNLHTIQQAELGNVREVVPTWEMGLLFFDIVRDELAKMEPLNNDASLLTEPDVKQLENEVEGSEDK